MKPLAGVSHVYTRLTAVCACDVVTRFSFFSYVELFSITSSGASVWRVIRCPCRTQPALLAPPLTGEGKRDVDIELASQELRLRLCALLPSHFANE